LVFKSVQVNIIFGPLLALFPLNFGLCWEGFGNFRAYLAFPKQTQYEVHELYLVLEKRVKEILWPSPVRNYLNFKETVSIELLLYLFGRLLNTV